MESSLSNPTPEKPIKTLTFELYLEINDDEKDQQGGKEIGQIRGTDSREGRVKGPDFVGLGEKQVEQRDDSPLEFDSGVGFDGDRGKGPPDDVLADVCRDEEGDPAA